MAKRYTVDEHLLLYHIAVRKILLSQLAELTGADEQAIWDVASIAAGVKIRSLSEEEARQLLHHHRQQMAQVKQKQINSLN